MMSIRPKTYVHILIAFNLLAYALSALLGLSNLANVLSALCALFSAIILAAAARRSSGSKNISFLFRFGSYACFAWFAADTIWTLESWGIGGVPDNSIMTFLYVLTSVFVLVAITVFISAQLGKWNRVQMVADAAIILLLCVQFFWIFLFDQDFALLSEWVHYDVTSILCVVTDIIVVVFVLTWKIAVRNGKVPRYFRTFAIAAILFSLVDLTYYMLDLKGLYTPNSLIDITYSATLVLFAMAALTWTGDRPREAELEQITNIGSRRTSLYLLSFPMLTLLLQAVHVIQVAPTLAEYGIFGGLILIHLAISKYIQLAIENDRLWKLEKKHSELLEQTVADQAEKLAFFANKDPLTMLCNRRCFSATLAERLQLVPPGEGVFILGVDIDRLKTINEAFGHDAGDKTVLEFSRRLGEWNGCSAELARISGDEFAVLLPKGAVLADAERACEEILKLCDTPFEIDGNQIKVSLSIGVAQRLRETDDAQTLMENMGIAIRQAKSQGYHTYQIYNPAFSVVRASSRMEHLLRQANIEKEFMLYFQPQFSLSDRRLIGAEALLRWNNEEIGFIPPSVFIPVAEEIGVINEIGMFVLRKAIQQAISWNRDRNVTVKIGVNISPKQLRNDNFAAILREIVLETGVDPGWLDAEITESMVVDRSGSVAAAFAALKELGISVSIDDFGAGFSAIGYLNSFHFDRIKIDKSLVDPISDSNISGVRILKSIVEMAKALGALTISEGVETNEQFTLLEEVGCDQAQGYFLGRPVPAKEFERMFLHL
ncbi:MAG: bifunctional diguanylate cyclase/phosphodiesterase [Christensenella sp.]